jgi:hypothetical protein
MAIPKTRCDFKKFCLRKLGAPVITVNLSEEQVEDAIDQALYFFSEYHMDGGNTTYLAHKLTQDEITSKQIQLPDNIIGVTRVFPFGSAMQSDQLFNMRYQFVLNDLYSLTNVSIIPYTMVMSHIAQLEEVLVGQVPIRYTRHENILYLDCDTVYLDTDTFIVIDAYYAIDPYKVPDCWRDKFLQEYATALMQRQWGTNLSRFTATMPSGIKLNGALIKKEADEVIKKLETDAVKTWSLPSAVFMG